MEAHLPLALTAALNACATGSRWYDGAGPLRIVDALALGTLSRPAWLLLARSADGALYFCPLAQDPCGAWSDPAASSFYQREVLACLQRRGTCATLAGGSIDFEAALDLAACELLRADAGGSSNTVSRIACGPLGAMHKLYRKLETHEGERAATEALGRSAPGLVSRCLGSYRYRAPDGASSALGLFTEYIDGHGLHQDLSANLRALWPLGPEAAQAHLAGLLAPLAGWRVFVEDLHAAMARSLPCHAAVDMDSLCAQARGRLARIRPQLADDPLLTPALRPRLQAILDGLERLLDAPAPLAAAPCHGDLHLSHLLWDGVGQRRIIDLSPPPSSHPLQDWVALERALDYFCLDEAALELAPHAGLSQEATMAAFLTGLPASAAIDSRMRAWRGWQRAVRAALCGERLRGPVHDLFHAARLLQELDYNYSHRRPYYRCIDLYFLTQHFQ